MEVTVDFFTDVLVNFPRFFDSDTYDLLGATLGSDSAKARVSELKAGDFQIEADDFSRLLFAYADAAVQDLARNNHGYAASAILDELLDLLNCEGYEEEQLRICSQAIEFWQTYTEHLTDARFSAGDNPELWMNTAKQYVAKALQHSWAKIRYPEHQIVASWDATTRTDFRALRQDFTDLVQASFTLLGLDAFEYFAQSALECLVSREWVSGLVSLKQCLQVL